MKYDPISRRLFLRGIGGAALALPFIPSLVPVKAHAASTTVPLRYVHQVHWNGAFYADFFPADDGLARVADGVYALQLKSISTGISRGSDLSRTTTTVKNLGSGFDPYRGKMTVVRGLDLTIPETATLLHGKWTTSTASHDATGTFGWSIDMVLQNSKKIYPTAPVVGGLRMGFGERTSIWNSKDQPFVLEPRQAFEQAFGICGSAPADDAEAAATLRRRKSLVDRVYEDYKRHRDGRFISAEGKQRLDDWMTLVSELEAKLDATVGTSTSLTCDDVPADKSTISNAAVHDLYNRITVAALAAGNTRIVTQRVNGHGDDMLTFDHSGVHAHTNDWRKEKDWQYNTHFLSLLKQMDSIKESNGKTLLDNSIVFNVPNMGDSNHRVNDLAVVLAGGGADGKLRMGQYIDYRQRTSDTTIREATRGGYFGRPYNEFLITLFNAFGLGKDDYQQNGQEGFGYYGFSEVYGSYFKSKNTPLPYLYTG